MRNDTDLVPQFPATQGEHAEQAVAVVPATEAMRGDLDASVSAVHVDGQHRAV